MNFLPDEGLAMAKFNICQNCRHNHAAKLGLNEGVADLLCHHCNGLDSNYDALRSGDHKELSGKVAKDE